MARPKKQQHECKGSVVSFRLTDAEHSALAETARRAGVRPNEFARILTIASGNRIVIKRSAAADPALLKRLDRIGINLNQLAKNSHIFGRVSPQVPALCAEIEEIINEAAAEAWEE